LPSTAPTLYLANWSNELIIKITAAGVARRRRLRHGGLFRRRRSGCASALALAISRSRPGGRFFGNLYIADLDNFRIRKVTPDGIIRTVAGNGQLDIQGTAALHSAAFNVPGNLATDAAGNVYVTTSQATGFARSRPIEW